MSAEAAALTKTWQAGRYTCTLTLQRPKPGAVVHAVVEWQPTMPTRLTDEERAAYRRGRDAALAEMSAALNMNAAVLEL